MRKTVLYIGMSLDGYIADPNGGVGWMNGQEESAENGDSYENFIKTVDTVIMALVGLIMVPYYLGEFGLSVYAIIPLATTITNYFLIVSDSLSNAFSRYMVMAVQSGDMDGANRVFTTSVLGMGRVIVMLLPVVAVIAFASPYIFNIGPSAALDVQLMFLLIAVSSLLISFTASPSGSRNT